MQYLDKLLDQFIKAENITKKDYNSRIFLNEFSDWILQREKQSKYYMCLVSSMGIDITRSNTAEIGKTSFDSIAKDYYSTIVTKYTFGFNTINKLIDSSFMIDEYGYPNINMKNITRIMTNNPYSVDEIKNWDIFHNKGGNILVGIYGNISDYDLHDKIDQLKQFKELLNNNYIEEELTVNNTFCKVLATAR